MPTGERMTVGDVLGLLNTWSREQVIAQLSTPSVLTRHLADRPRPDPEYAPTRYTLEQMEAEACLSEIRAALARYDARLIGDEDGTWSVTVGNYGSADGWS